MIWLGIWFIASIPVAIIFGKVIKRAGEAYPEDIG